MDLHGDRHTDLARNAIYDRNSQTIAENYTSPSLQPHSWTVRFTYTVPSNRKCFHTQLFTYIASIITTAGRTARERIEFKESGGSYVYYCQYIMDDRTAHGERIHQTLPSTFYMIEGDAVRGSTYHNDTSNKYFSITIMLVEFDE